MNKRLVLVVVGVVGLIAVVAAGWYLVSPLFIDNRVEEAFPFEAPEAGVVAGLDEVERGELEAEFMTAVPDEMTVAALAEEEQIAVAERVEAAADVVMMDKALDEDMMAEDEWTAVVDGLFVGADEFHMGEGRAAVFEQGEQQVLRFEDFSVTNGPDLHVILSKHAAPLDRADIGEDYLDLGSLKGNLGNQNYEVPAGVDLSQYQSVVIYCVPFHVVFATAELGD
jgi:hypothetical protein